MMKIGFGWMPAALLAVASVAFGQETRTKETKVGISTKGIEISRKRATRTPKAAPPANAPIKVTVDEDPVAFPDQGPMMRSSRVLVPLRGVFEKMGATVDWNRESNTITATGNGRTVVLPLGSMSATVDGKKLALDQPAAVVGGRALVPLRFLGESLGATVDWRASDMTVAVKSGA
ncbi:MAG: copper amine oxidase N-terminal domain-containing protein [Fimbriimonas sp.]